MTQPKGTGKSRTFHSRKNTWIHVGEEEASGQKVDLSALRKAAEVYLKELKVTAAQNEEISRLYDANYGFDYEYRVLDDQHQLSATSLLAAAGLDFEERESLANRWATVWTRKSGKKKGQTCRILFRWCVISLTTLNVLSLISMLACQCVRLRSLTAWNEGEAQSLSIRGLSSPCGNPIHC